MEALNLVLGRLPILLLALAYMGYSGFIYYNWTNEPTSEFGRKKEEFKSLKTNIETIKGKIKSAEEFYRNVEVLKSQIRENTMKLEDSKAALSGDIDMAAFIRMLNTEAKKLNLGIKSIRPDKELRRDFYTEFPFNVQLHGAYIQMMVFFDRLVKFPQLISVTDFSLKPTGDATSRYVELDATVRISAYKYLGTKADEVAQKMNEGTGK